MSRRIVAYDADRRPIWEDLGPAENVQWGTHIGGQAIVERVVKRGVPMSDQAVRTQARRAAAK